MGLSLHPMIRLLVATAVATLALAGCGSDRPVSRSAASVVRVEGSKVCLIPEDASADGVEGCYRARDADLDRLTVGACIEAVIPGQNGADGRDDELRNVRVLDRPCKAIE